VELRIDELALRTGITSRNIRAYQQRGLLPAPRLRGRTGFYGEDHLRRLELIRDLQQRGFSLEAIRQILAAWTRGGDISDLIGFHRIFTEPWTQEPSVELDLARLAELFPEAVGHPELIAEAVRRGVLTETAQGRFEAPAVLIEAGAELAQAGIPMAEIFDLVERVRAAAAEIARTFVDLVTRRLIDPIAEGATDADEVHRIAETIQRLRTVAVEVVRPFLGQELRLATELALEAFRQRTEAGLESGSAEPR
jgi:DNA-binding transcriptional MerR regulator